MTHKAKGSIVVVVVCFWSPQAMCQDFSVDSASPEVPGTFSPADVSISSGGGSLTVSAADLDLLTTDNIDAVSHGLDVIVLSPGLPCSTLFTFSVGRTTVGSGIGPVSEQVAGNGASGDKFEYQQGDDFFVTSLLSDASTHGLSSNSDVDALTIPDGMTSSIYFSVDPATATRLGVSPGDILFKAEGGTAPVSTVIASWASLGLDPFDDIDALAISNVGAPSLDNNDIVYISLTPSSPSATFFGAASIIQVVPGPPTVKFSPSLMGLADSDDLNALTILHTAWRPRCPSSSAWSLLALGLVVLVLGTIGAGYRRTSHG